jgi:hypothetical protein
VSRSSQTTQQNSTTTTSPDPFYSAQAWNLYNLAQNIAANYKPVPIPTPLDFNSQQVAAQNILTNTALSDPATQYLAAATASAAAGLGAVNPYLTTAANYANAGIGSALNYQPKQVNVAPISAPVIGGDIPQITAGNIGGSGVAAAQVDRKAIRDVSNQVVDPSLMTQAGLQNYVNIMDPSYKQAVIDATMKDLNRQNQMALLPVQAMAAQQGAYGGDRQAILEAETNRNYGDIAAQTIAGLNYQGYQQAVNNYLQDLARQQQVAEFNSANNLQAQSQNQAIDANAAFTNAQMQQQAAMTSAQMNQAAQIANAQMAFQASTANAQLAQARALAQAQMQYGANEFNANLAFQSQLANNASAYQAANLGLSAGLSGAQIFSGLGNQALNSGLAGAQIFAGLAPMYANLNANDAALLSAAGNQQYALDTAKQQAAYLNAVQQANLPLWQLQLQQQALAQVPYGTTTNSSGQSTTTTSPSLFSQIMSGIGLGTQFAGLGIGLFGGGTGGYFGSGGALTPAGAAMVYNPAGTALPTYNPNGTIFMSDERLKTNIRPMVKPDGYKKASKLDANIGMTKQPGIHTLPVPQMKMPTAMSGIRKLKGVSYNWRGSGAPDLGFTAQNVERVLPGAVKEIGGVKHVSLPGVVGLLTEGMKELDRKVNKRRVA